MVEQNDVSYTVIVFAQLLYKNMSVFGVGPMLVLSCQVLFSHIRLSGLLNKWYQSYYGHPNRLVVT